MVYPTIDVSMSSTNFWRLDQFFFYLSVFDDCQNMATVKVASKESNCARIKKRHGWWQFMREDSAERGRGDVESNAHGYHQLRLTFECLKEARVLVHRSLVASSWTKVSTQ
jgi:hypothetical protein